MRHAVEIVGLVQKAVHAVLNHFGQPANARCDDRNPTGHGLERSKPEALLHRRQQEDVGSRQERHDLILLAEEIDVVAHIERAREPRRVRELWAVANHQQAGGHTRAHAREHLDDGFHPFHGPEIGDVNQQLLIARRQPCAKRADLAPAVRRAIDEVRNHPDLARDPELADRLRAQALGHGRDAVRLIDAEGDRLGVRRVASEQRDVGSVQRRDHARDRARTLRPENLPRQVRGGRVRYRVVRMHDIETFVARHLHDLVRQRQQKLRFTKQRVARRLDPVE